MHTSRAGTFLSRVTLGHMQLTHGICIPAGPELFVEGHPRAYAVGAVGATCICTPKGWGRWSHMHMHTKTTCISSNARWDRWSHMHMHTKSGASCAAPLHMHGHCRWRHMPPVHMHTKSGASCAAPLHMHGRTNAHCSAYAGGPTDFFFTLELRYVGVS